MIRKSRPVGMVAMPGIPDFAELLRLEPRLRELEGQVRAVDDDGAAPWFCSNFVWLSLQATLKELIGVARIPQADDESTSALFDGRSFRVAYAHLSRLLPPCRSCGCRLFGLVRASQLG